MAITSKEINLSQLDKELGGHGLVANFEDLSNKIVKPCEGSPITEEQLVEAINSHVAIDELEVKAAQKAALLEKLGITEEEAKLLLS